MNKLKVSLRTHFFVYLSIFVFTGSLFTEAFYVYWDGWKEKIEGYVGWPLLFFGWLDFFDFNQNGWSAFTWLANPLLLLSWLWSYQQKNILGLMFSLFSVLFMLLFLRHSKIVVNESMMYGDVIGYGMGYWLWLSSAIIMCLCCLFRLIKIHKLSARY